MRDSIHLVKLVSVVAMVCTSTVATVGILGFAIIHLADADLAWLLKTQIRSAPVWVDLSVDATPSDRVGEIEEMALDKDSD